MQINSRDHEIQQALQTVRPVVESQSVGLGPAQQAAKVQSELKAKGINSVARVNESGNVDVKRVLIG